MRNRIVLRRLALIVLTLIPYIAYNQPFKTTIQNGGSNQNLSFYEIRDAVEDYWSSMNVKNGKVIIDGVEKKVPGWKLFKRWENYWEPRINMQTGEFPQKSAKEEYEKFLQSNANKSIMGNWENLGISYSDGGYAGIGRINCVGFHPTNSNIFWIGSPAGGLWQTTDGGVSWTVLTDENQVLGVSDIAIPSDYDVSGTIYIATGDRDGGSLWSLGGGQYNDNNTIGILKSTDFGATWESTGLSYLPSQKKVSTRLLIDPNDDQVLYSSNSNGIFKTINGGTDWTQVYNGFVMDMEFKPGDSQTLYVSTYSYSNEYTRIYRSTDGGANWSAIYEVLAKRTELAVSVADPLVIYALIANYSGGLHSVVKSTNGGDSFVVTINGDDPNSALLGYESDGSGANEGQGDYDLAIAASPTNSNIVFIAGINCWKSSDGGNSWNISNHWWGDATAEVHADKHFLGFQPTSGNLFETNDGGVYKTTNLGNTWTDLTNGITCGEVYRIGTSGQNQGVVLAGHQDNGTKMRYSGGAWYDVYGGDGMECAFDPTTDNTYYVTYVYGEITRMPDWTTISYNIGDGSLQGAWVTPYCIDPSNSNTLYVGYEDLWKSTNKGNSFVKIGDFTGSNLRSLAVAPSNSQYIYTADYSLLHKTTDGGATWTNATGSLPVGTTGITYIAVKADDPNTVWVTLGGYNANGVYETTNGGSTWTNISGNLPQIPIMTIVQNKQNTVENELYIGTDVGIFLKRGNNPWESFMYGLPNVVVTELEIYYDSNPAQSRIVAGTFGRGVWQSDLYSVSTDVLTLTETISNISCSGLSDGAISIDISDGTQPYEILWNTGETVNSISGLSSGYYSVTVSDIMGATGVGNYFVIQPAEIQYNETITGIPCNGQSLGSIVLNPSGGTEPYSYSWNTGETDNFVESTTGGVRYVTLTDFNGCTSETAFVIPGSSQIEIISDLQLNLCYEDCYGMIETQVSGGTSPYLYSWSNGSTEYMVADLCEGTYFLTLTDAQGCDTVLTYEITNPPLLVAQTVVTHVSSQFENNGSVTALLSGGVPPYTYEWSNGVSEASQSGIGQGEYILYAYDSDSCIVWDTAYVYESSVVVQCGNSFIDTRDGQIYSTLSNGDNCVMSVNLNIGNFVSSTTGAKSSDAADNGVIEKYCYDNNIANCDIYGGLYDWNEMIQYSAVGNNGICPDGWHIPDAQEWHVFQNSIDPSVDDPSAIGAVGTDIGDQLKLSGPSGFNSLFSGARVSDGTFSGLAAYASYWTSDEENSTDALLWSLNSTDSFIIREAGNKELGASVRCFKNLQQVMMSDTLIATSTSCYGSTDGSVNLSVLTGTSPFSFLWSNDSTSEDISGLSAGWYYVTITSADDSTLVDSVEVMQPDGITASFAVTDPAYPGNTNGAIDLTASGGAGGYSYFWSNGSYSQNQSVLGSGTYTVTITDGNGCTGVDSATVNVPVGSICDGPITDERDGKVYQVVQIGAQCWMAENLNVGTLVPSSSSSDNLLDNGVWEKFCYSNSEDSCTVYGGLYQWTEAMDYLPEDAGGFGTTQGICPNGWHMPTWNEWMTLITNMGGAIEAGSTLKETGNQHWALPNTDATNSTGFTALPGGYRSYGGSFLYIHEHALFWTSKQELANYADLFKLMNDTSKIYWGYNRFDNGHSVRCIKNVEQSGLNINLNGVGTTCYNGNNGTIDLVVLDGQSPFSFIWSNNETTEDISGLSAGFYSVTVTDALMVTAAESFEIVQPDSMLLDFTVTNSTCAFCEDGEIVLNVSGGTSPYSFLWSSGDETSGITNLVPDSYLVTVTDASQCEQTGATLVGGPAQFECGSALVDVRDSQQYPTVLIGEQCWMAKNLNVGTFVQSNDTGLEHSDVSDNDTIEKYCFNNSEDSCLVYGGLYDWSELMKYSSTPAAQGICPQGWRVPVEEDFAILATTLGGTSIAGTELRVGGSSGFNALINGVRYPQGNFGNEDYFSCFWSSDSSNTDKAYYRSVFADYEYFTMSVFERTYGQSVRCILHVPDTLSFNYTKQDISCFGLADGSIDVTVSGGTAPFNYSWSNDSVSEDLNTLNSGTYILTVMDAFGEVFSDTIIINEPEQIVVSVDSSSDMSCYDCCDGNVYLSSTGGTGTLSYLWSDASTDSDLVSQCEGTYYVTISDDAGCSLDSVFEIVNPFALAAVISDTVNPTCFGSCNGELTISASLGIPPYEVIWSTGDTTFTISGLCAGLYTAFVIDSVLDSVLVSVALTEPAQMVVAMTSQTSATCDTCCNGTLTVSIENGNIPLSVEWENGDTGVSADGLCKGFQNVTVTDNLQCSVTDSIYVYGPDTLILNIDILSSPLCFGDCNGSLELEVLGGYYPLTFEWSNGESGLIIDSLCADNYSVLVADAQGNTATASTSIVQPDELVTNIVFIDTVSCDGCCDALVNSNVSGGVEPYAYLWSDSQTDSIAQGLCSGSYFFTVTDNNGCIAIDSFEVVDAFHFELQIELLNGPSCYGECDAEVHPAISGGIEPFTYLWSDGSTLDDRSDFCAGEHILSVTDSQGKIVSAEILIENPEKPEIVLISQDIASCDTCCDGSIAITAANAASPYGFVWSNGDSGAIADSLCVGMQYVTLVDASGCMAFDSIPVGSPDSIVIYFHNLVEPLCNGNSNAMLSMTPFGGNPPYFYSWSDGSTDSLLSNVSSGWYGITVIDIDSHISVDSFYIDEPIEMTITFDSINYLSDPWSCDGYLSVLAQGGTGYYLYDWSNSEQTSDISDLCVGFYTVTVSDENECFVVSTIPVYDTSAVNMVVVDSLTHLCSGVCEGYAQVTGLGGTPPYTYTWDNGSTDSTLTSLCEGQYFVTLYDSDNDSITGFITVVSYDFPTVLFSWADLVCDGDTGVVLSGGSPAGGEYLGDFVEEGIFNAYLSGAGNHTVSYYYTDSTGCESTVDVVVTVSEKQLLELSQYDNICANAESITLNQGLPAGGMYTVDLVDTVTVFNPEIYTSGLHSITYSYQNMYGCKSDTTVSIFIDSLPEVHNDSLYDICIIGAPYALFGANPSGGVFTGAGIDTGYFHPAVAGIGVHPLVYEISDLVTGCYNRDTAFVEVYATPAVVFSVINPTCNSTLDGSIATEIDGGRAPFTYLWTPDSLTSDSIGGLLNGKYTVEVTDDLGCSSRDSVTLVPGYEVFAYAGNDIIVCPDSSVTLSDSLYFDSLMTYHWSPSTWLSDTSILTTTVTPDSSMTYVLRAADTLCEAFDTVEVIMFEPYPIDAGEDIVLYLGESEMLHATGDGIYVSYEWVPEEGISFPTSPNVYVESTPKPGGNSITYYVWAYSPEGCPVYDSVKVRSLDFIVPRGFSPNGDGINDVWEIDVLDEFEEATVIIYSRWGKKVFESTGYSEPWDGTSGGKELPSGTYYYVIEYIKGGVESSINGPVTIVR